MFATSISLDRRALRLPSMMLVAVAALTACDNETAVGPRDAAMPASAAMARNPGQGLSNGTPRVSWSVQDPFDSLYVEGAVINFHDGTAWYAIADNSASDLDKAPGKFEVLAPNGVFSICQLTPPPGFVFEPQGCTGYSVPAGQTTYITTFAVYPEYNAFWFTSNGRKLVGPATYVVKSMTSRFATTVVDEGKGDRFPSLGRLRVVLPAGGDYQVCQTKAAPNTQLANPACITITVQLGQSYNAGMFLNNPI